MKLRTFLEQMDQLPKKHLKQGRCCPCFSVAEMKAWLGGAILLCVFMVLVVRVQLLEGSFVRTYMGVVVDGSRKPSMLHDGALHVDTSEGSFVSEPPKRIDVARTPPLIKRALSLVKSSAEESAILSVWKYLIPVLCRADNFPELKQALKESDNNWKQFANERRSSDLAKTNKTTKDNRNEKQCPYSVSTINQTLSKDVKGTYDQMEIPCGLVVDSAITFVGLPWGAEGNFAVELLGPFLPGEIDPPIILHYNVRLQGDKVTDNPVIVQNTWSRERDWGDEERCPDPDANSRKVDGLDVCNKQIGKDSRRIVADNHTVSLLVSGFPFKNGLPFAATLWAGWEGFHMTVNGKHVNSFEYRENLKPSLVGGVRLKGSVKMISILATGLPASEDVTYADIKFLKAPPLQRKRKNELFIGVFSTANNFDRRMAVRRTWMQYESVRSGNVTVRFFVGQHSNMQVNKEIWREALTYGDIQLMPFVDIYNLITIKTIAICIFGTEIMRSKYIMKTDDDTFVRVDELLSLLSKAEKDKGLLYGSIEFDSQPHRDPNDKWYISPEEWPHSTYPPWAHGPGYIISRDIADFVVHAHYQTNLKLFKLEDVSMGIWIEEYKKKNEVVHYINDENFNNVGCNDGYVIAHYQNPKHMTCLWGKLRDGAGPVCCDDR